MSADGRPTARRDIRLHRRPHRPAARRVAVAIRHGIERLAYFPYGSRPSEVPGIRELPIVRYPYIVFYSVDDDAREVHVLRVRHTARDSARHLSD